MARGLAALGREGVLPPNDLAGFLDHASPSVRAAALTALVPKKAVPEEVRRAVIARLDDASPEVRRAAIEAIARLGVREAIPRLLAVANEEAYHAEAALALAAMPDPQALPVYLSALQDRSPQVRLAAQGRWWRSATAWRATWRRPRGRGGSAAPRRRPWSACSRDSVRSSPGR